MDSDVSHVSDADDKSERLFEVHASSVFFVGATSKEDAASKVAKHCAGFPTAAEALGGTGACCVMESPRNKQVMSMLDEIAFGSKQTCRELLSTVYPEVLTAPKRQFFRARSRP